MTEMTAMQLVQRSLKRKVEANDKIIAKLSADLLKDADYHMRWADSAMEAAAFNRVAKELLSRMEEPDNKVTIENALEYYSRARDVAVLGLTSQSTSQCTNAMNMFRLAAMGQIIELLQG
ncbi:hypothetical protein [Delftia phage PhiW-14]|uniref:Uncharacterized protein n=1 Tax=Delftia phage PhiW-14 TaxID=665032 RepID=C9DG77_BPW14|nr:hypothetical protein DP-phiW-14_gp107 [Delftia phage PhiW-14]ACV50128.1 hypothetical protein [Delftia phage PhiW-14]